MKYCQECGRMMRESDTHCPYCGTYQDVWQDAFDVGKTGRNFQDEMKMNSMPETIVSAGPRVEYYSFWKIILLSMVTCGIYGLYKNYKWTKDINQLCERVGNPSPNYIIVLLLSICTLGIYWFVWIYKQTERMRETGYRNGVDIRDSGVQNVLLSIFAGSIGALIVWYILYSNTNKMAMVYNGDKDRDDVNMTSSHRGIIAVAVIIVILSLIGLVVGTAVGAARYTGDSLFNPEWDEDEEDGLWGFEDDDEDDDENDIEDVLSYDYLKDYESIGREGDLGKYKINIKDAAKVYDFDGEPAIAITFDWGNNSGEEASPLWAFDISAFQNEEYLETTWPAYDDTEFPMENYLMNIPSGEKGNFNLMFEVDDMEGPVTVVVIELMGSSKVKAEYTFDLTDGEV